jgi:iron complex transport system ATP-binding protein
MMDKYIATIHDLDWSYRDDFQLFTKLNASFPTASFISIVGPNGSGKTTLLRHILRLLPVPDGTITLLDEDLNAFSQKRLAHGISYVPQSGGMEYEFTVSEFVAMGRYSYSSRFSVLSEEDHREIGQAMDKMGIGHLGNRMATELSGGEFQRMVIARALAQKSRVIALDEPVSHLDPRNQCDILRELRSLVDNQQVTVICILHDLNAVAAFSDHVIMIKDGRIVGDGTPQEVLTMEKIKEVYHVDVDILVNPHDGNRMIMPRWRT